MQLPDAVQQARRNFLFLVELGGHKSYRWAILIVGLARRTLRAARALSSDLLFRFTLGGAWALQVEQSWRFLCATAARNVEDLDSEADISSDCELP